MKTTRTQRDEDLRRSNIYWTLYERIGVEAALAGSDALTDMRRALVATTTEDIRFFAFFAGVNARKAATFGLLALSYKEQALGLR